MQIVENSIAGLNPSTAVEPSKVRNLPPPIPPAALANILQTLVKEHNVSSAGLGTKVQGRDETIIKYYGVDTPQWMADKIEEEWTEADTERIDLTSDFLGFCDENGLNKAPKYASQAEKEAVMAAADEEVAGYAQWKKDREGL